ncbi:MAG: PAS domain S-box protein [Cytophagales bacterium]|nr:PAS domain S-box protein [Cytophagales bacterium]MCA6366957.1 PAS domain S-box protein [Cytophagales bacterium]MCA6373687.1 PAS domain S-box protein [Cytophagales bacterium]MCA6377936.1 PAS domain S-box protein [Cytophagales bacterium]MCA6383084.1 PAS domain S-box protein [Cytophagales bacterium]
MAVDPKVENTHQLLQVTNNEFETLFNHATIGILMTDSNGLVVNFNKYAEQLFGYQKAEVIGKPVELLIPHGKRVAHIAHRTNFNEHPTNRVMGAANELFAKRKDDSVFPVEISLSHFKNDSQLFVIAFIIDITVRKQNEDLLKEQKNQVLQFAEQTKRLNAELEKKIEDRTKMLKETLEALENTQQETTKALNFQKAILNHAGACIIATDTHGVVQLFNSTAEEYLGYSKSEVIDQVNVVQFHLASEIQAKAAAFSREIGKTVTPDFNVLSAKSMDDLPNEHEFTYVRKNGTTFTVSLNVTTLRDAQNSISGFLGVAVDISEIKKYQNSLQVALEKEKQLGDLKSRFVTMASHEFRTPLSTILSSVSLIDKYTSVEDLEKREKHVKRIKSAVGNMKDILEDFLSLGKMEEGKIQLNPELLTPAELRDELEAVIQEMQRLTKPSQQITHTFTVTEDCNIDRKMLRHIMTNLISNAIKFSPEGSSVDVSCENRKNELIFTIQDTGIGISEADQKHLFERFFRAENASNIQGTGLGLHIISRYLDLVDGHIELASKLNKGSTFIVHIPQ